LLNNRELERQILHILVGSFTVLFIYTNLFDPLVLFMIIIVGIIASFLSTKGKVPIFHWFLKRYERKTEIRTFPGRGMIFFFVSSLIALKLFPFDIALASIMILTLGDSVSHIVGGHFGKIKNPLDGNSYKLLEGSIAGMFAGFLGAVIFVSPLEALFAAIIAMTAEAVEIEMNKKAVDDNLVVPLVAGVTMLAIRFDWLIKLFNFIMSFWPF